MSTDALNMDFYKRALLAKAEECRSVVLNARHDIWGAPRSEVADQSSLVAEREIAAERVERCYGMLRRIEAALFRLKRGRYGLCLNCEEPIGPKRLDALPWALFCIGCQERIDLRRGRGQGARQAA